MGQQLTALESVKEITDMSEEAAQKMGHVIEKVLERSKGVVGSEELERASKLVRGVFASSADNLEGVRGKGPGDAPEGIFPGGGVTPLA